MESRQERQSNALVLPPLVDEAWVGSDPYYALRFLWLLSNQVEAKAPTAMSLDLGVRILMLQADTV